MLALAASAYETLSSFLGGDRSAEPDAQGASSEPEEAYEDPYESLKTEKWFFLLLQIFVVFFATGGGSIGTGVVLSSIAHDEAFIKIKDLYLLMPVLQGLKGNVDTCLAARISTQSNLGNLSKKSVLVSQIISNIALVQVQSIVGALIVSLYSVALGAVVNRDWNYKHALLLAMAASATTCVTSFFLDLILIGLILLSHRFKINPDNIICPIAATAADLTTLVVFSTLINSSFYLHHQIWWAYIIILCVFIFAVLPISIVYSLRLPETKTVLFKGWYVLLVALVFSCMGSLVLDSVVEQYRGYVLFQPVLNGTTGNLATILCTRLSTMLYKSSSIGSFHEKVNLCVSPHKVWFKGTPQALCVRLLILVAVPGQLVFVFIADYVYTKATYLRLAFVLAYLFVSILHMLALMYISHLIVHTMWKYQVDPDNSAIPFVSAIGDFLGSSLLAAAFAILLRWHQEYLHGLFGQT